MNFDAIELTPEKGPVHDCRAAGSTEQAQAQINTMPCRVKGPAHLL